MTAVCPHCGQIIVSADVKDLLALKMEGQHAIIIRTLANAYPDEVSVKDIIHELYGTRSTGAQGATSVLRSQLTRIRKILRPYGWTIPSLTKGGATYGRYRLAVIKEP